MKVTSLKLPDELRNRVIDYAETRGITPSELIREAIQEYLATKRHIKRGSFLDTASDVIGSLDGPSDLSFNKKYRKGYGQ